MAAELLPHRPHDVPTTVNSLATEGFRAARPPSREHPARSRRHSTSKQSVRRSGLSPRRVEAVREAREVLARPCSSPPGRRASACRAHGRCSRRGRPVRAGDGRAPDRYVGSGARTEHPGPHTVTTSSSLRAPNPPEARGVSQRLAGTTAHHDEDGPSGRAKACAGVPVSGGRRMVSGWHGRRGSRQVARAARVTPYARPSPCGGPRTRRAPAGAAGPGAWASPEIPHGLVAPPQPPCGTPVFQEWTSSKGPRLRAAPTVTPGAGGSCDERTVRWTVRHGYGRARTGSGPTACRPDGSPNRGRPRPAFHPTHPSTRPRHSMGGARPRPVSPWTRPRE